MYPVPQVVEVPLNASDVALRLGVVLLLVLMNGFMVASELALVAARRSRIQQMVAEGGILEVIAVEGRRVAGVRVHRAPPDDGGE
jgi:CBS domain containing-hemolysin-like protein